MKSTAKIPLFTCALMVLAAGWNSTHAAEGEQTAVASKVSGTPSDEASSNNDASSSDAASGRRRDRRLTPVARPTLDRSGHTRIGKASFYAKMFNGRTMADGTRMEPTANNAASRTLPLGTTAKVTNLETGKTAVVTIRDRGPYVAGRIVDLSPATAREIGLDKRTGITQVKIAPIAVPMPDGEIKLGDGVTQANNRSDGGSSSRIEMRNRRP
jgi:rare lipoprotein A